MTARLTKQVKLIPSKIGVSAEAITAGAYITGTAFGAHGYNQMTVEVFLDYTAATTCLMYIETSPDNTNWHEVCSASVAGGTATLSRLVYSKATGAADSYFTVNVPINYEWVRLRFSGAGAAGVDTVTATVRLGNV